MHALTNDRWGFPSNCFVCEATNEAGLRIPYFHDEANDTVVADFELDDRFSGAPSYVHGGLQLAVLDEAMAWAAIAVAGRWAVTAETSTRFTHPVRVGRQYTVTARITSTITDDDGGLTASATITDTKERLCAEASATFVVLGEAHAVDATGVAIGDNDRSFLRPANGGQPDQTEGRETDQTDGGVGRR